MDPKLDGTDLIPIQEETICMFLQQEVPVSYSGSKHLLTDYGKFYELLPDSSENMFHT